MRASPRVSCRCSALARFSDAALRRLRAQAKRDSWLLNQAIEFYSCFISYSHAEKPFAYRLHDTLQSRGIRCWLDEHQVLPGDAITTQTAGPFVQRKSPSLTRPSMDASIASSRSLSMRIMMGWVSGSPKRQLNSNTMGPRAVIMMPQ